MPFALTSDQESVRKLVAELVARDVAPEAERIDHERAFPRGILSKVAELGLLGMLVPPEKGGAGTDTVSYAIAAEEMAKGSGTTALALVIQNALVTWPLAMYGADGSAAAELLPTILSGRRIGAYAVTEPGAGSDLSAIRTRASEKGSAFTLNGLKSFVVGAPEADSFLVLAREGDGLSFFLVDRDAAGVRIGPVERMMSMRGSAMAEVFLKDVSVPASARLGNGGDGVAMAADANRLARLGAAAIATGTMQAAIDASVEYANERQQFRQPIKNFQAIQWKVAEMDADTRASRLLTYAAAAARDAGESWDAQLSAAKLHSGEAVKRVTQQAIRIHGGTGFMREMPLERLNRDGRSLSLFGATSEMERAAIAGRLLSL
ncbi:MAG: acyl-CoA dehydrogenase family protein [Thermoplasmatota archaeon]